MAILLAAAEKLIVKLGFVDDLSIIWSVPGIGFEEYAGGYCGVVG
jgi:hypothetical protein